jgi:hypothetical protein
MLLKDDENGGRRVTGLKGGGEWMGKEISLGEFLVGFQRVVED